jgi:catechol 2,3-dioxygenase-like lactoylglutathione lyase family enzyme
MSNASDAAIEKPSAPVTQGVHHIGLTVPDLHQTRHFFVGTLGFSQVGDVPDYPAVFLSDGTTMLTLWQAEDPATATPFDRKSVIGLHHFALRVDAGALDRLSASLSEAKHVDIEFEPEALGGSATRHLMCTIPGGIRMELIAPSG